MISAEDTRRAISEMICRELDRVLVTTFRIEPTASDSDGATKFAVK